MKLTSAAVFCFMTLLAQFLPVPLAVGRSARKNKTKHGSFPQLRSSTQSFMQFLRTWTAVIINFICLKCQCADTQMVFTFSCALGSQLNYTANISISPFDLLGWPFNWEIHILFKTKPKSEKPSTSLLCCLEEKALIRAILWPKRTACMV